MPADGLAPKGARSSAVTAMTKFMSRIYTVSALEGLARQLMAFFVSQSTAAEIDKQIKHQQAGAHLRREWPMKTSENDTFTQQ